MNFHIFTWILYDFLLNLRIFGDLHRISRGFLRIFGKFLYISLDLSNKKHMIG